MIDKIKNEIIEITKDLKIDQESIFNPNILLRNEEIEEINKYGSYCGIVSLNQIAKVLIYRQAINRGFILNQSDIKLNSTGKKLIKLLKEKNHFNFYKWK